MPAAGESYSTSQTARRLVDAGSHRGDTRHYRAMKPVEPGAPVEVLIIGGGPAGLSLGVELQRRGVPFLILERGATVGDSWAKMPRSLKLVSPWKSNSLPGTSTKLFPRHRQISREEFFEYIQQYAEVFQLPVLCDTEVHTVEKLVNGPFRLRTSGGDFFGRAVVNASGYFSNPFVPSISGASESAIPQLHAAKYRDVEQIAAVVRSRGSVLIVGKRLTAGQTMVELVEAGFTVAISHRSPIQFGAAPFAWWFLFRIFPALEWLKLKRAGARAPSNDVRMAGGAARKLIESGNVKTFPEIERFDKDEIAFANGQRLRPDLVLMRLDLAGFGALCRNEPFHMSWNGPPAIARSRKCVCSGLVFSGSRSWPEFSEPVSARHSERCSVSRKPVGTNQKLGTLKR